jgi:hypothetical protein
MSFSEAAVVVFVIDVVGGYAIMRLLEFLLS